MHIQDVSFEKLRGARKNPFVCQTSAIMSKSPISRNSQKRKTTKGMNMKEEKGDYLRAAPLDGIIVIAARTIQHNPLFGGVHV